MIFNSNSGNDFVRNVQNHELINNVRTIVRFNHLTTGSTVVRCSHTQKKAFMNLKDGNCELVLLERLQVLPENLKNEYRESGRYVFDFAEVDTLAKVLHKHLVQKSEYILSMEKGLSDKLTPTFTFGSMNESNVFVGRITKLVFDPDYIMIQTSNGNLKISGDDSKNLHNVDNAVGRYLLMNSKKEFIIVPGPIMRKRVKEH